MKTIEISKEELKQLYDKDFPLWAEINLELLRDKAYDLVDWENLLEEIQDMGLRHLESCISYLAVILEHLYKLDSFKDIAGGETAGSGWKKSVLNSRTRIMVMFKRYPSLKTKLPSYIDDAWIEARGNLEIWLRDNDKNPQDYSIPEKCPYTYEEALNREV